MVEVLRGGEMARVKSLEVTAALDMFQGDRFLQRECVRWMVEELTGREVLE